MSLRNNSKRKKLVNIESGTLNDQDLSGQWYLRLRNLLWIGSQEPWTKREITTRDIESAK